MQQVAGGVRGIIVAALAIAPLAAVPPARIAAPQRRGGTQAGGLAVGEGADEAEIIRALRCGDEGAFARLVGEYHGALVGMAMLYVADRTAAEEVAQETWLAVLRGIDRFEGRSSLKTWIFRILTNRAQTRGQRESRTVPFAALARAEAAGDEPTVDPARFRGRRIVIRAAGSPSRATGTRRRSDCSGRRYKDTCAPRLRSCPRRSAR